jgi:hypothetical protein
MIVGVGEGEAEYARLRNDLLLLYTNFIACQPGLNDF